VLGFDSYLGIDISSEALRRARALGITDARLELTDMDEWEAAEQFDVIILNESLYYSRRPVQLLQKQARWLLPGGALIVSMHCNAESPGIWRAIEALFQTVDSTIIHNRRDAWEIRLLRSLPAATPE
jgi:trans-aconitate methyltransferase